MRSNLRKEKVVILGSVLLIAILAAFLPFALRVPTLAKSLTASANCACACPGKVTGGGQIAIECRDGKASFGFNIVCERGDPAPKGELEYVDHTVGMFDTAPMQVHAHDMLSLAVWDKETPSKKARFTGECTIDHESGFTFEVYVEDNDEPGKDDVFTIKLFEGSTQIYYGEGDPILHGNIQIHKKP